ncbi:MAG: kinase [Clostridiales bacterium]|jgi:NAD+ kinase|nr:kinase [Clostridiales bacterium]
MNRVLIHANRKTDSLKVKTELTRLLKSHGKVIDRESPEVIIVIGGDGTMLSAIRKYKHLEIPFVGIDTGTLGFLTTIMPTHLETIFEVLDRKDYRIVTYPLLMVETKTLSGGIYKDYAFNEIVIKHVEAKLMEAKVYVNGKPFNYFTGDGLIFSTPIGATGYAIWAGGAVVHSDLPVFQMTPLTPNDNSVNRPISSSMILPEDTYVDISVLKSHSRRVILACDGVKLSDECIEDIHIKLADDLKIHVIRSDSFDYFDLFKRKIIDKNIRRILE